MLKLYGFNVSNYVNMIHFALLEKGAEYEFVTHYPAQDEAALALNPVGKVPVLETEHGLLTETAAILEYIDEVLPGPSLFPGDAFQRARVRQLMHMIELYVELPARRCYPEAYFGGRVSEETKQEAREAMEKGVRALARATNFTPYTAGDSLSAADAMLLYSMDLAAGVARKLFEVDLLAHAPGCSELLQRLNERDSARRVAEQRTAGMEAYRKYIMSRAS